MQAAQDRLLAVLGRQHTREQFECAYNLARDAGFSNINIDVYKRQSLWGADILCAVRNAQPDMRLLTCFTLGSQATVDMLEDIEGAVMPAFYPVDQSAEYKEWSKRYEEK